MTITERLLDRMQRVARGEALDSHDLCPARLHCKHGARLDRTAVKMDGAAAALAGVAANMRSGEAELITQEVGQKRAVFDFAGARLAVNIEFYFCHDLNSVWVCRDDGLVIWWRAF